MSQKGLKLHTGSPEIFNSCPHSLMLVHTALDDQLGLLFVVPLLATRKMSAFGFHIFNIKY